MNRLRWLTAALLASAMAPALAQAPAPVPFDMTPESELVVPAPEPAPQQLPAQPAVPQAPAAPQDFARYVFSEPVVRLAGEESRSASVVYLTQAQAETPARLEFSYINALVVAPEVSNLRVRINQTEIAANPIASSASAASVAVDIPPGLLRAGANTVEFRASQRHRTDCSIGSTYELWTELQSEEVRLRFADATVGPVGQLADLAAVGVDETGATTVRILQSSLLDPQSSSAALRIVQELAIALRVADMRIETVETLSTGFEPGVLDLVIGPAAALPPEFAAARQQAGAAPLAAMVPGAGGANVLVLSGPDWAGVAQAGNALVSSAPLTASAPRIDLPDPHPMMLGGQVVQLSDLNVETQQFNGRRLVTQWQFELPSDFYAYRYGELELVLDAAYSGDVLPGSELDIYTNGQIASATPLLRTDGGLLRDTVIRIPMTNLRPGRNEVALAVNLQAASDATCSAGWTGDAPTRFVLSNTSQLRLPDYARAASVPDLLVVAGSGWPYIGAEPVPVAVGAGTDTLVSAMLVLARIAAASGEVLPVSMVPATALSPADNGIVVMPMGEMPPPMLAGSGVALAAARGGTAEDDGLLNQFNTQPAARPWSSTADWLLQRVGLDIATLHALPQPDAPHVPAPGAVVMSQVRQPEGGIWTVLTAGDSGALREGAVRLVDTPNWRQIAGRISTFAPNDERVTVIHANSPGLVETQPFSFSNARLVAANWFSGNILYFTAAIVLATTLLMLASSFVLTQLGRRK